MAIQTNWYKELLEDLRKLEYTGIVLTKWNIGKRILEDEEKFGDSSYGSKRIENIAKDLQASIRDIYYCIQFYKKYPKTATPLQNSSWREVIALLPEPKEKSLERIKNEEESKNKLFEKGKYKIIYADPAWNYFAGGYKNQSQHYDSMSIEDICNLPIKDLADENCILFLWVTFPILDRAFEVINAWGFTYSTVGFNWIKSNKSGKGFFFGLGNWTRANSELCLIATKGSIERKDASISQIIYEPIGKHSEKPAIVRDKIVKLVGDLPRIELFARQKIKGWDSWGNEI